MFPSVTVSDGSAKRPSRWRRCLRVWGWTDFAGILDIKRLFTDEDAGILGSKSGTANTPGGPTAAGADNSIAMYVFQYQSADGQSSLPIHDHRDNFNGGFAFATYHPGTALPQQPWAL